MTHSFVLCLVRQLFTRSIRSDLVSGLGWSRALINTHKHCNPVDPVICLEHQSSTSITQNPLAFYFDFILRHSQAKSISASARSPAICRETRTRLSIPVVLITSDPSHASYDGPPFVLIQQRISSNTNKSNESTRHMVRYSGIWC